MKFIITESKRELMAFKWLNDNYGDLEIIDIKKYPEDIQYNKDGQMIFNYNIKTHNVFILNQPIWSFLTYFFGFTYDEVRDLTKKWVEDRFGLEVQTTLTYPKYE